MQVNRDFKFATLGPRPPTRVSPWTWARRPWAIATDPMTGLCNRFSLLSIYSHDEVESKPQETIVVEERRESPTTPPCKQILAPPIEQAADVHKGEDQPLAIVPTSLLLEKIPTLPIHAIKFLDRRPSNPLWAYRHPSPRRAAPATPAFQVAVQRGTARSTNTVIHIPESKVCLSCQLLILFHVLTSLSFTRNPMDSSNRF